MRLVMKKGLRYLVVVFLSGAFFVSCQLKSEERPLTKRPNILFAISDDQSFPHAGIYGFSAIKTPAFDKVANAGVLFTNAFAAAPQCSPSRAAILTGRNIWELEEAGTHGSSFPRKFPVFTDALRDAGYQVGYTGKPWGPGNWERTGWEQNPVGTAYNELKVDMTPTTGIKDNDYAGNFRAFLAEKSKDQPFFFWYGGHEPHRVYQHGSGASAGKNYSQLDLPAFLPDDSVTRNDFADYLLEIEYFDAQLLEMLKLLEESGQLSNTIVVVTSDNGMPFPYAKANLQAYGTHVPLAIAWEGGISQGIKSDELVSLIDLAPTFLELAGLGNLAEASGKSLVPLLQATNQPEFVNRFVLTGRERHTHARPENLSYPARAIRTKEYLYIKNYAPDRWPLGDPVPVSEENDRKNEVEGFKDLYPGFHDIDNSPTKAFMMSNRNMESIAPLFELAFEKRPSEQLYNIEHDPFCLSDVSSVSSFASVKLELRNMLDSALSAQGDPRMTGSEIFDSYPRYAPMRNFDGFNQRDEYNPDYK